MRVLVADDHSLFRDGIVSLLQAAGFEVVGQVSDGEQALEATRRLQPDLVLLDIAMPGMDGLETLRGIKSARPETRVVMLTVSDDDRHLFEAVRSGAEGYMLKNLTANEFLQLLQGLEQGEAAMTRRMAARLMKGMADQARRPEQAAPSLTPRELELLQLVAEGLSNRAIGQRLSISENTVKYHMKHVLQKLGAQNRTEAVSIALRAGLIEQASS